VPDTPGKWLTWKKYGKEGWLSCPDVFTAPNPPNPLFHQIRPLTDLIDASELLDRGQILNFIPACLNPLLAAAPSIDQPTTDFKTTRVAVSSTAIRQTQDDGYQIMAET